MDQINEQRKELIKALSNIDFDVMRNNLPNLDKINQAIEKIKMPDSVFKEINKLVRTRENFVLSLQPSFEQQRVLTKSVKQFEEFSKGIMSTGIFLELSKIQKLNIELFTSSLTNVEFPILNILGKDLYFSELALQPELPEKNEESEKLMEADLFIGLETERKLRMINPVFAKMYKGAVEASVGNNADRARHVAISLRELFTKLLNKLCPTKQVIVWIDDLNNKPKDYLIAGKPSRKAQINYYYRDEKDDFLERFVNNKILLLESLINTSTSVHENLDKISSDQLVNLIRSARYLIDDLLIKYDGN